MSVDSAPGDILAKPSYNEYRAEIIHALGFPDQYEKAESLYNFNMRAALQGASQSDPFLTVVNKLKSLPAQYLGGKPDLLFYPYDAPENLTLTPKSFKSVINKLYRRNVLFNNNYPNPPRSGFVNAENLYTSLDDLLRSRLVCKYMDGPEFIIKQLNECCDEKSIQCNHRELSTEAGYYAWHFYFIAPVEISAGGEVINTNMWMEIQFTTQLAELISTLTHDLYQGRRDGRAPEAGWKWKPSSPEFRSSYIGHGLHLLEGVIQSFRDDVLTTETSHREVNELTEGERDE